MPFSFSFLNDCRFAFRVFRKSPAFSAMLVSTLALGIGVNTAIFSAVHAVLLRDLPFHRPDRLVFLYGTSPSRGVERDVTSVPNFLDWREQATNFSAMSGVDARVVNLSSSDGEPEALSAAMVSPEFFEVLGVSPLVGRFFKRGDDGEAAPPVAVLSHAIWKRRFGGDPGILGRTLMLNDRARTVVGVARASLRFPQGAALYLPAVITPDVREQRGALFLPVIGRLKDGVTLEQARKQVATVAARLEKQYPATNTGWSATAVPFHEDLARDYRPTLLVMLSAVGLVLLAASANVANLLLSRAVARTREISIRVALGAGRLRILRQVLVESAVVALAGGFLGLLFARFGIDLLTAIAPSLPVWATFRIDGAILLYNLAISLFTGLAFGSVPAFHAARTSVVAGLKASGSGALGGRAGSSQAALVVFEVALAVVVLAGAGLMLRSLLLLQREAPGFQPEGVLAADISLTDKRYPERAHRLAFAKELTSRVAASGNVASVSMVSALPLGNNYNDLAFRLDGKPEPPPDQRPVAGFDSALPGYFHTMEIPFVEPLSRDFSAADTADSEPVTIVNDVMARRYWPGEDAIGKTFTIGRQRPRRLRVIGVVGAVRRESLGHLERPHFYMPYFQQANPNMSLVVKTKGDPSAFVPELRSILKALDAATPLTNVQPMTQYVQGALALSLFTSRLLSGFAILALGLAALGLYSVMSYAVARQTREIGIRIAIGARSRDILTMVTGRSLRLTLAGLVLGLATALLATRLLGSLLHDVKPGDPLTLGAVSLTLGLVGVLAAYLPGLRATRVDPQIALRAE